MEKIKYVAPCMFGLESVLSDEIKKLGAENVTSEDGRVSFEGGYEYISKANIWLRTAERVEIVVGSFIATTFDQLYEGIKALDWERYIGKEDEFPVKGWSLKSQLFSIPDCQSIIKKAIVDRLSSKYGIKYFDETGPVHSVRFSIMKNVVTAMIDTSGPALHKRGWRAMSNEAPIKETLAAGIVALSRPYNDSIIYDPFCGSGTIAIEAALKLANIAPGIARRFESENWLEYGSDIWIKERENANDSIQKDAPFRVYASDIDPNCTALTLDNAKKAGVEGFITVKTADITGFEFSSDRSIVMTNPPYGERLLDIEKARMLTLKMRDVFPQENGRRYSIISSDDTFEQLFGRRADKRRKLYNGMLKCQLYMYFKTRD